MYISVEQYTIHAYLCSFVWFLRIYSYLHVFTFVIAGDDNETHFQMIFTCIIALCGVFIDFGFTCIFVFVQIWLKGVGFAEGFAVGWSSLAWSFLRIASQDYHRFIIGLSQAGPDLCRMARQPHTHSEFFVIFISYFYHIYITFKTYLYHIISYQIILYHIYIISYHVYIIYHIYVIFI